MLKNYNHLPYRKNIVLVILNRDNKILLISRNEDEKVWQFPQGGVKKGETLENAVLRETAEEIGTTQVRILGQSKYRHKYIWPSQVVKAYEYKYKGQSQTIWFLLFDGTDIDININKTEVGSYQWVDRKDLLDIVESKRRELAKKVDMDFDHFSV